MIFFKKSKTIKNQSINERQLKRIKAVIQKQSLLKKGAKARKKISTSVFLVLKKIINGLASNMAEDGKLKSSLKIANLKDLTWRLLVLSSLLKLD